MIVSLQINRIKEIRYLVKILKLRYDSKLKILNEIRKYSIVMVR